MRCRAINQFSMLFGASENCFRDQNSSVLCMFFRSLQFTVLVCKKRKKVRKVISIKINTAMVAVFFHIFQIGIEISDGSVNSRSWKIYARKQFLAFHKLHFTSVQNCEIPFSPNSSNFYQFNVKSQRNLLFFLSKS